MKGLPQWLYGLKGIATDCKLSLTTEGLPEWLCGLRHCDWVCILAGHVKKYSVTPVVFRWVLRFPPPFTIGSP